ncbi:MAG: porin [Octadecabacter sp.]|nr:porin [Octadecabacter sp.]
MKNILLATTALVAFAGAAAAEGHTGISFTGSASLGFNNEAAGDNDGFYSDLDIVAGFAAELDNGLTAAASLNLDDLGGGTDNGTVYELSLTSATAGLFYGDTSFAAQNAWAGAGSMDQDGFSEADGEESIRGQVTFGDISGQVSYVLANNAGTRNAVDDVNQLSLGVTATVGTLNIAVAYQEASGEDANFYASTNGIDGLTGDLDASGAIDGDETGALLDEVDNNALGGSNGDFNDAEVFGISVGTTVGGADVRLAYAETGAESSTGLSVSYPVGDITLNASYSSESAGEDNWDLGATYASGPVSFTANTDESDDWGMQGSYDAGNGLVIFAGLSDGGEDTYVAGTYDLGSGASLLVSFADDGDNDAGDEVGANDYQHGTTIEVSLDF